MNQSSAIFGAIFVSYFVFITMRSELPIYAGFLLSSPQGSGGTKAASNTSDTTQQADIVGAAVNVLALA